MTHFSESIGLSEENERSLQTLLRTIRLTSGRRFELILVRCNVIDLRTRVLELLECQLLESQVPVQLDKQSVPVKARQLYSWIESQHSDSPPAALCILNLEDNMHLDELLLSTNQVRDEFRKNLNFPLIIWITDEIAQKIVKLAPDFHNWSTPISFFLDPEDSIQLLKESIEFFFENELRTILQSPSTADRLFEPTFSPQKRKELLYAFEQVTESRKEIGAETIAGFQLLKGRQLQRSRRFSEAVNSYEESLAFWERSGNLKRQGLVLFHLGICYQQQVYIDKTLSNQYLENAEQCLDRCLRAFNSANCIDFVASCVGQFAEVIKLLGQLDYLEHLAHDSLKLHVRYPSPVRLARDYGFLSHVNLERKQWNSAKNFAERALSVLDAAAEFHQGQGSLYLLLLAKAHHNLGQSKEAIYCLEKAKQTLEQNGKIDPKLLIEILSFLKELYFNKGDYVNAFEAKQEQRSIESRYSLRAFIGAGRLEQKRQLLSKFEHYDGNEDIAREISASDRRNDIRRLVERIEQTYTKLTIIHGQSGVGKSSTVIAGLMPTLRNLIIGSRDVLPIRLEFYQNWEVNLGEELRQELIARGEDMPKYISTLGDILETLRRNEDRNLVTVLIFDQFEEFFIRFSSLEARRSLLSFIKTCYSIPYVQTFLILREDYLHYILDFEHIKPSDQEGLQDFEVDILSSKNRYEIGNFSSEDARSIIKNLTEQSQYFLEEQLIDALVEELSRDLGEVRPIELQIVGAQLQADKIATLAEYHQRGPKSKLVQRYLQEVVEDCGPDNKQAAELVLYLLTGEDETRPPKTRAELENDLKALANKLVAEVNKLDLVLQIFVRSGLVFLLPAIPANRYQLVHDYLVTYIRRQQEPRLAEQLEGERQRAKKAEEERDRVNRLYQELRKKEEQLEAADARLKEANQAKLTSAKLLAGASILSFILGGVAVFGLQHAHYLRRVADLERNAFLALQRFEEGDEILALVDAVDLGREMQHLTAGKTLGRYPVYTPLLALNQIISEIRLLNVIPSNSRISGVSISGDSQLIALASESTAYLWAIDGKPQADYKSSFDETITAVRLSADGQYLILGTNDGAFDIVNVKTDKIIPVNKAHDGTITSIRFTKDGSRFVTASVDGTAKLWSLQNGASVLSKFVSEDPIWSIDISPSRDLLATASDAAGVIIWDLEGNRLQTLSADDTSTPPEILDVSFSPDSRQLATAGSDGIVTIWELEGNNASRILIELINPVTIHSLAFDPNGNSLVTTLADGTTRLWNIQSGQKNDFREFRGHTDKVTGNQFSLDGSHLATVDENSVHIWNLRNSAKQRSTFNNPDQNTPLRRAIFTKNDEQIVTVTVEGQITLWTAAGEEEERFIVTGQLQDGSEIGQITDLDYVPNHQELFVSTMSGCISGWSLTGGLVTQLQDCEGPIWSFDISSNDRYLAAGGADGQLRLYDLNQGKVPIKVFKAHESDILDVEFDPDSKSILTVSVDGKAFLWNLEGEMQQEFTGDDGVRDGHEAAILSADFNSDGSRIVTASAKGTVLIYEVGKSDPQQRFSANNGDIFDVKFSPNLQSDLIVTATAGGIKTWSLTGRLLAEYNHHRGSDVQSVEFDSEGKLILAASVDSRAMLYPVKTLEELLGDSCQWLKSYIESNRKGQSSNTCSSE